MKKIQHKHKHVNGINRYNLRSTAETGQLTEIDGINYECINK